MKDKNRAPHAVESISDMFEHYVTTDIDDIPRTRLRNPKYRGWLPSEFGADKQYWKTKGVNPGHAVTVNCWMTHIWIRILDVKLGSIRLCLQFQLIQGPTSSRSCTRTLSCFLHLSIWKLKLKSTNTSAKSSRTTSESGPLYAVERLKEIKITLQDKRMLRRTANAWSYCWAWGAC